MDSIVGPDSGLSSYSLFHSVGSEPSHLWSNPKPNGSAFNKTDPNLDQLFVFGYSCKLFRDDRRAKEIDSGQHLIGWNGSSDHLIDRFDVRGYLNDLSQFQSRNKFEYDMTPEELEIERMCDEERYADLKIEPDNDHDEELKRLHIALAEGSVYNEIGYNYDQNSTADTKQSPTQTNENITPEDEQKINENDRFKLPPGLFPPEEIILPESQKLHNIIEKTALFVSQHGLQMEIILKTKQSNNKNFDFLSFDSSLHSYYKHLLECIKSGKYVPNQSQNSDSSDSDDDSDGEHYLHPSLLGSNKNKETHTFKIPHLLRGANTDDSYSQLVKSLKDFLPTVEEPNEELRTSKDLEHTFKQTLTSINPESNAINTNIEEKIGVTNVPQNTWSSLLPSPPPDIEQIIEKLAQKVALSGEQFELSIKKLGESRFDFVNPGHIYHAHYIRRKLHYLEEHRSVQAKQAQVKLNNKKCKAEPQTKPAVSFSINTKDSKPSVAQTDENLLIIGSSKREDERIPNPEIIAKRMSDNALKDKLALAVRDKAAKDKQEERKRKAAVFLSLLKNKSKEINKAIDSNEVKSDKQINYGVDSVKSSNEHKEPLSPTIAAVTSPNASPERSMSKENELISLNRSTENSKSVSLLPFTASDKPLKESSSSRHSPHRHHKSRHSSAHKSHKRKSRSRSRSRSSSRSPSRSHRKRSKRSKSRSRSRSRSHSHRKR